MKSCTVSIIGCAIAFGICASAHAQAPAPEPGKDPEGVSPNHYQCYRIRATTKPVTVSLRDQFGVAEKVLVGNPLYLCAPTMKNNKEPRDQRTHYLCYEDKGIKPPNRNARIINQFGDIKLTIVAPAFLCVPSLKELLKQ